MSRGPTILLLDGDYPSALTIAKELSEDVGATIVGAGTTQYSRLLRSKYCDIGITIPPPEDEQYGTALKTAVLTYHPQFVLPVGYQSTVELGQIRSTLPSFTTVCLPENDALRTGADKATTIAHASALGINVPADYSDIVDAIDVDGRPGGALDQLNFPVFLKARHEDGSGNTTTARVDDPSRFWETYDRMVAAAPTGDVLVQELVEGTGSTYGVGLLCLDNDVVLQFAHEELQSVPRRGGSGTHLRIRRNRTLEQKAAELLQAIGWHGIALVEFRRRTDGSFVFMEVNPKFWASYALASEHGYRFASTMVAMALDLDRDVPIGSAKPVGEMVYPLRELYHCAQNPAWTSVRECVDTLLRSDVKWSLDRDDLAAWLTPPTTISKQIDGIVNSDSDDQQIEPEADRTSQSQHLEEVSSNQRYQ